MSEPLDSRKKRVHPKIPALRLFLTPNGKSKNWYAVFYSRGTPVRQSMGTSDYDAALRKAADWYLEKSYEIKKGTYVAPSGPKFSRLKEPALTAMAARGKSAHYVTRVRSCLADSYYVSRFFGNLAPDQITSRAWDDFRTWLTEERIKEGKPLHSERTVHQMKNAVKAVLSHAYAQKIIEIRPKFEDPLRNKKVETRPRVRFEAFEIAELFVSCQENIEEHKLKKSRWREDSQEMFDFVRFMLHTGLRVGECLQLRFCDVQIRLDDVSFAGKIEKLKICDVRVLKGKMGAHSVSKSDPSASGVMRNIIERRKIDNSKVSTDLIFVRHHREMFKEILKKCGLSTDQYGRRRDFVSLRHTYICEKLIKGVPIREIARNTRTSVAVIENHYARTLPVNSGLINTYNFSLDPKLWNFPGAQ